MPRITYRKMKLDEDVSFEIARDTLRAMDAWTMAPPIPWRNRVWWQWQGYRGRIELAWEVLRGRHDCGDW